MRDGRESVAGFVEVNTFNQSDRLFTLVSGRNDAQRLAKIWSWLAHRKASWDVAGCWARRQKLLRFRTWSSGMELAHIVVK